MTVVIGMHLMLGVLIGAVVVTIILAIILINLIRNYSKRLYEMDRLIRTLHKGEFEAEQNNSKLQIPKS